MEKNKRKKSSKMKNTSKSFPKHLFYNRNSTEQSIIGQHQHTSDVTHAIWSTFLSRRRLFLLSIWFFGPVVRNKTCSSLFRSFYYICVCVSVRLCLLSMLSTIYREKERGEKGRKETHKDEFYLLFISFLFLFVFAGFRFRFSLCPKIVEIAFNSDASDLQFWTI